ncbi:MAG: hypothetical protein MUO26_15230 [Methanotrichaceae archaeon]|nr:hypothetical protein [Methanotrichaceae archaeon]
MKRLILPVICFMIAFVGYGAAVVHINETIGDLRISYDTIDANMITKYWNEIRTVSGKVFTSDTSSLSGLQLSGGVEINKEYVVYSENRDNLKSTNRSGVMVFFFKKPVNTTDTGKEVLENPVSKKYMRVYDKVVDGHNAIFILSGDGPNDPLMTYVAGYWLDEVKGMGSKLVMAFSDAPNNEIFMNTVHVEMLPKDS